MVGLVDVFNTLLSDGSQGAAEEADTPEHDADSATEALAQHGNLLDEADSAAPTPAVAGAEDPLWTDPTWDPDTEAQPDLGATSEPEAEAFDLFAWLDAGGVAAINSYDPAQEQLVVVYDPQAHSAPELRVEAHDSDQGPQSAIFLDGHKVAEVSGRVSVSDITLFAAR